MGLIDDMTRARASGNGARKAPTNGLHYCSRCGKRSHKPQAVQQHIEMKHNGEGEVKKEPSKAKMLAALLAAEELADMIDYADRYRTIPAEITDALAAYRKATESAE